MLSQRLRRVLSTILFVLGMGSIVLPVSAQTTVEPGPNPNGMSVKKFRFNGVSAQAAFVDSATQVYSQIYVSQDKITGATLLDFVSYGPDPANPTQSIFRAVYGTVPTAAFTVSPSLRTARLALTTPSDIFTIDCVVDVDGNYHCQYNTPFSFDVTWSKDDFFASRGRRQLTATIGLVTTKSDEDGLTYGARMNGTLPGATAVNALGALSDSESKWWTREISVTMTP